MNEDKQPGFGPSQSLGKGLTDCLTDLLECWVFFFLFFLEQNRNYVESPLKTKTWLDLDGVFITHCIKKH